MAVTDIVELFDGIQADADARNYRKYVRKFLVEVDDKADTPYSARTADLTGGGGLKIPDFYEAYAQDAASIVVGISADRRDAFHYTVTVSYSTSTFGVDATSPTAWTDDPISQPDQWDWASEQTGEPAIEIFNKGGYTSITPPGWFAKWGYGIVNSSGEPFDPPAEYEVARPTLAITTNKLASTYEPFEYINDYVNTVNSSEIGYTGSELQWRLVEVRAQPMYTHGIDYWRVTYAFRYRRDGWRLHLRDEGYYTYAAGVRTQIKDSENNPIHEPALLDGSGGLLAAGAPAHYLTFGNYEEKDWTGLGVF